MGDPVFDLGDFSVSHDVTAAEDAILLEAYAGRPPRTARLARPRLARPRLPRVVSPN